MGEITGSPGVEKTKPVSTSNDNKYPPELFDGCDDMVSSSKGTRQKIEAAGITFKTIRERFSGKEVVKNVEKIEKNGCSVQYNVAPLEKNQFMFEAIYIVNTNSEHIILTKKYNSATKTTYSTFSNCGIDEEIIQSTFKPQTETQAAYFQQKFTYPHGGKAQTVKTQKMMKEPNLSRATAKTIATGEMYNARGELILRAFDDQYNPDEYIYRELSLFAKAPDGSGKRLEFKAVTVYNSNKKRDGGEIRIKDNNNNEWILPMFPVKNRAALNNYFKRSGDYSTYLYDEENNGRMLIPYKNINDDNIESAFKKGFNCTEEEFDNWYEKLTNIRPPQNVASGNMENYYKNFESIYNKL